MSNVEGPENRLRWEYHSAMAGALPALETGGRVAFAPAASPSAPTLAPKVNRSSVHGQRCSEPTSMAGMLLAITNPSSITRAVPPSSRRKRAPPWHYGQTEPHARCARGGHSQCRGIHQKAAAARPTQDEAVMSLVGSDNASSNQVNLVRMCDLNCIDEVLVAELRTEVERNGVRPASSSSSLAVTRSAQPAGATSDGALTWGG